jgi:hypothetical protein
MVSDAHKKPVFLSIFLLLQIGLKQRAEFSRTLKRGGGGRVQYITYMIGWGATFITVTTPVQNIKV